jgi:hypothetical protein
MGYSVPSAVPKFSANVEFRFDCESVEAASTALRRLQEAAQGAGFDLVRGTVTPAVDDEDEAPGTSYGPLTDR